jgi:hypothetical protein
MLVGILVWKHLSVNALLDDLSEGQEVATSGRGSHIGIGRLECVMSLNRSQLAGFCRLLLIPPSRTSQKRLDALCCLIVT